MPIHDSKSQRLYCDAAMTAPGDRIACTQEQTNYLARVLRLGDGAEILTFNGSSGEWQAKVHLKGKGKRECSLELIAQIRPQTAGPDIEYLFAPLKRARLDYIVQKAVELGVAALKPVYTQHTVAERVNLERMRANAIEAAEQCGILCIPNVHEPAKLPALLQSWDAERILFFADENAEVSPPLAALGAINSRKLAVLIGPEGGFSENERSLLANRPFVVPLSLGPRVMRADTAAVALLALVNATLGDWR